MDGNQESKKEEVKKTLFYYGEHECMGRQKSNGKPCRNQAYWSVRHLPNLLLCGTHSKQYQHQRSELPPNPDSASRKREKLESHRLSVTDQARRNLEFGRIGGLWCDRLLMMRNPTLEPGVLNVFPNFAHANRKDGFGCPDLSPKSLGPVDHGQPGLPLALSIENYHQFNKVFPNEVDELDNPLPRFYDSRRQGYLDPIPHRHKFSREEMTQLGQHGNKNVPLYSIHLDEQGNERRFTYLQSRAFYCRQYQLLASQAPSFAILKNYLLEGTNLRILGYDGYALGPSTTALDLRQRYEDTSKPFGHELVLYSMLQLNGGEEESYPWNSFVRENAAVYEGMPGFPI